MHGENLKFVFLCAVSDISVNNVQFTDMGHMKYSFLFESLILRRYSCINYNLSRACQRLVK